jgi:SAM-dependent methyltransferase
MNDLVTSYDRVAAEYVARIYHELAHKPFDRELLDRFAQWVSGPVLEVGCGPGQVARYLHERGVAVSGLDISPGMVAEARRLNPAIPFQVGDMRALAWADGALAGVVAFYSLIHVERVGMTAVLQEWKRVLQPGGWLLYSFHIGNETIHLDEWWEKPVFLDFHFFQREEMEEYTETAGFVLEETIEREPYPEVEAQTRRGYIFARKPG